VVCVDVSDLDLLNIPIKPLKWSFIDLLLGVVELEGTVVTGCDCVESILYNINRK
jgi:hypothetical protein